MSEVFTAKANDTISTTLREIGHISMERDIRPAMRRAMDLVERNLKARISENSKGYNLDRHAQRGVKSKPWTVSSNSKTFGFTTFLVARSGCTSSTRAPTSPASARRRRPTRPVPTPTAWADTSPRAATRLA